MKYIFVDESWEDYLYWQKTDKKKLKRIIGPDKLEEEAIRNLIFICMKQQCILRMERLGGLLLHSLKNINLSYRS